LRRSSGSSWASTRNRHGCWPQPGCLRHRAPVAPPIASGEQRQAHASHVIHVSWFDTTLDVPRELSAKDQILSAGRAGIRKNEMLSLRTSESIPMIAHVNCSKRIMRDSACVYGCRTPKCARRELLRATIGIPAGLSETPGAIRVTPQLGLHDYETWYATKHNSALRGARRGIRCGAPHFCG
jgi:hypothetical protein